MNPYVWHPDEITEMPHWADHGWFYGLVQRVIDNETALVVAEIFPGEGYALVGLEANSDDWDQIAHDLAYYKPENLGERV